MVSVSCSIAYLYLSFSMPSPGGLSGCTPRRPMVQVLTKQQKRKEHYILIPLKISKEVFKFLDKCKTPNKCVLALLGATAYCQALSLSLKSKGLGVLSKTRATTAPLGWVTTPTPPGQLGYPGTRGRCLQKAHLKFMDHQELLQ